MARRSRRRSYGSFSLAGIPSLEDSVKVMDVLTGLAVGIVGSAGLTAVVAKFAPTLKPTLDKLGAALPAATGVSVGAILYYAQKGSGRAVGHAVGAALAGLTVSAVAYLKAARPLGLDFGAPAVALNLGNYAGLLVDNTVQRPMAMNGLIVDNNANLGALGALSMGGDDEQGYADIVALRS